MRGVGMGGLRERVKEGEGGRGKRGIGDWKGKWSPPNIEQKSAPLPLGLPVTSQVLQMFGGNMTFLESYLQLITETLLLSTLRA